MKPSKKIKGFTLVELVVVIAIISILSGIMSLVVMNFVRSARLETLNDKAHMIFTGFQNMLTQCEIKQDDSLFLRIDAPAGKTGKDLHGVVVYFHIASKGNGATYDRQRVGNTIEIINVYKDSNYGTTHYNRNDANAANKATYEKLEKAIVDYIPEIVDGTYAVFINYEDYTVDSVACRDLINGSDPTIAGSNLKTHSGSYGYYYWGLNNRDEQKSVLDNTGIGYGVYPYGNEVGVTFS